MTVDEIYFKVNIILNSYPQLNIFKNENGISIRNFYLGDLVYTKNNIIQISYPSHFKLFKYNIKVKQYKSLLNTWYNQTKNYLINDNFTSTGYDFKKIGNLTEFIKYINLVLNKSLILKIKENENEI